MLPIQQASAANCSSKFFTHPLLISCEKDALHVTNCLQTTTFCQLPTLLEGENRTCDMLGIRLFVLQNVVCGIKRFKYLWSNIDFVSLGWVLFENVYCLKLNLESGRSWSASSFFDCWLRFTLIGLFCRFQWSSMSRYSRDDGEVAGKVYVGDLPRDASEKELERAFRLVVCESSPSRVFSLI